MLNILASYKIIRKKFIAQDRLNTNILYEKKTLERFLFCLLLSTYQNNSGRYKMQSFMNKYTVPQVCRKGEPFVDLLLLGNLAADRLSAHLDLHR